MIPSDSHLSTSHSKTLKSCACVGKGGKDETKW